METVEGKTAALHSTTLWFAVPRPPPPAVLKGSSENTKKICLCMPQDKQRLLTLGWFGFIIPSLWAKNNFKALQITGTDDLHVRGFLRGEEIPAQIVITTYSLLTSTHSLHCLPQISLATAVLGRAEHFGSAGFWDHKEFWRCSRAVPGGLKNSTFRQHSGVTNICLCLAMAFMEREQSNKAFRRTN